ncbi:uncharacterized protein LOC110460063 [Mizuhopecten yessoensis]|uniref:uncharacterized protein LOC110460063 n=1 Tax=Mizuhopecten yessoensis TaxID=6573 RepID=UPI000B4573EF|nr:uncharacterized protein LOC110460063 [Mizuhopecten yessoensis]
MADRRPSSIMKEVSAAERVPRGTGDQPSLGNCLSFTSGGISRLHWYSCCNNCKNGVNSTCLSIYQSASKEQYCNKCGRDTKKGNGKPRSDGQQFNCGGCQGQANVDRKCRSWWKEIPGFCWAYSLCFKKQCEGKYKNCGNRVCDDGETKDNCPIDCCDEPCCEVSAAERVLRRTGDQPSLGNCLSFTFGGISRLHWYSCCNNCKNDVNSTCPSTYQSASKEQYCDKCGRDTKKGNGKPRSDGQPFNCGGCKGQANVDKKCRSWWKKIPGFCWAYSLCFKKQCEEVSAAERVLRRTGDQPSLGNCLSFTFGGISRLHWYSCCNNCKNDVNSTCPSTYQSASKEQYCDKCGRDTKKGNGKPRSDGQPFNCGGCKGQANVDKKCRSWWKKIPGFCWAYSLCFKQQCEGKYKNCGNRVCDVGETKENCPIDCCDLKNNPCCGEPGCCAKISKGERVLLSYFLHIIAVVVLTFIFN